MGYHGHRFAQGVPVGRLAVNGVLDVGQPRETSRDQTHKLVIHASLRLDADHLVGGDVDLPVEVHGIGILIEQAAAGVVK